MKLLTQLLVIVAIITAGISPACAFMGADKAMMEICASDGSVRHMTIPEGFEDLLPADVDENAQLGDQIENIPEIAALDNCPFCIFQSAAKTLALLDKPLKAPENAEYASVLNAQESLKALSLHAFSARAPPFYS